HYRSVDGRHLDLGAEHLLVERHRRFHPDIVAVARVEAVRRDMYGDDRVARPRRSGLPLAREPDLGPVLDALGKLDADRLAAAEGDALLLERRRVLERHRQPIADVRPLLRRRRRSRAPPIAEAGERPPAAAPPGAAA